jgi:predicted nucleic acid-binding protein
MKPRVYIETTVISYLTSRPSRDLIMAARQEVTREVWSRLLNECECFVSAVVVLEAGKGDESAAARRLAAIRALPLLHVGDDAERLAQILVSEKVIPTEYGEDALHVATAALNGMDFVVTWNFTHINNAATRHKIRALVEAQGLACPELCSPEEVFGELE